MLANLRKRKKSKSNTAHSNIAQQGGDDMNNAKVIQVIQTVSVKGNGTELDPCREVIQYWDFEGNLIVTKDPLKMDP